MSVLPRDDSSYVDTEGHMYGELAVKYSDVLAKVLADDAEEMLMRKNISTSHMKICMRQ